MGKQDKPTKKRAFVVFLLTLGIIICIIFYMLNQKTTPKSRLIQQFNIDLSGVEVKIGNLKEQWYPNGDGFYYVEISIVDNVDISKVLIANKFKSLPILEDVPQSDMPNYTKDIQKGYYKLGSMDTDLRNFKIAIYDSNKKMLST